MASVAAEPVSPELALVCPEVRARGLALLELRDLAHAVPSVSRPAVPPAWLCAIVYTALSLATLVAKGVVAVSAVVLLLTVLGD